MRVGIVGCGHIGQIHLSYLMKTPEAAVVAVCDEDETRAKQTAQKFGVPSHYANVGELLYKTSPNVVHVSTPPSTHAPFAIQALEAGCHVLVEKPFALSLGDAERVIAAARNSGRKVCVDHNHLFDPPVVKGIEYLQSGVLGEFLGLRCFQGMSLPGGVSPNSVKPWIQELPLGPIHDIVPHTMAFIAHFLGISTSTEVTVRKEGPWCTNVNILAERNSVFASCTVSITTKPFMHRLELYGTKASLEIDIERMVLNLKRDRELPFVLRKALPPLEESFRLAYGTIANSARFATGRLKRFPGIGELIRRFYLSLRSEEAPPVSTESAREVVRLTDILVQQSREKVLCASS